MKKLGWAGLVLVIAAVMVLVAQTQQDPGHFAFQYYWSNDSVGNYVADLTVVVLGARKVLKEWRAHQAHQHRLSESLDRLHEKSDMLHAHLRVPPPEDS